MNVMPIVHEFISRNLLRRSDLPLDPQLPLIERGYLTSLQTVELVTFLEERFRIEIDPLEVDEQNFGTLSGIASLIEKKLEAA